MALDAARRLELRRLLDQYVESRSPEAAARLIELFDELHHVVRGEVGEARVEQVHEEERDDRRAKRSSGV